MSKSKKGSLTKAQKEGKKYYNKCKEIYLKTAKGFTEEQAKAFDTIIGVFKENYATDQCVDFAIWMKKHDVVLDNKKETMFNNYIKFRQSQLESGKKINVN